MRLLKWATTDGPNLIAPVDVPTLPKKAKGTKKPGGRDQTPISRTEVLAILDSLPEHYAPGADYLRLTDDIDNEGNGRPLWLTARAREALEAVAST